jgi:hypothetical protein
MQSGYLTTQFQGSLAIGGFLLEALGLACFQGFKHSADSS